MMIKRIRLKPKKAYGQKQILVHFGILLIKMKNAKKNTKLMINQTHAHKTFETRAIPFKNSCQCHEEVQRLQIQSNKKMQCKFQIRFQTFNQ